MKANITIAKYLKLIFSNLLIIFFCQTCLTQVKEVKDETFTIGIYMAADNDLFPFAGRNIKQMQNIGSNERLNIVVHFDMHKTGYKKVNKRLLIKKNKIIQIGPDLSMDSGNVNTLIDFCKWQIENFPADNYVLVLWNHGTGIIEPKIKKAINPSELFTYNSSNKMIELNRNIGFLEYINSFLDKKKLRGICIDDTTGNYLTNKNLKEALHTVCTKYLNGKKLAILACDACLMSMIEVVSPLKDYVEYFVGSEEVELGTGYDYSKMLSPFTVSSQDKSKFACHIVQAYKNTYDRITYDYTQSALDLSKIKNLEENISQLAQILINGLLKQANRSVKENIRLSKHKNFCTHFDEPTYIDLGHFYNNLLKNLNKFVLINPQETEQFKLKLSEVLTSGLKIINNIVLSNVVGKNLKSATGISIYFPENHIHSSYSQSDFANNTSWNLFLKSYIKN